MPTPERMRQPEPAAAPVTVYREPEPSLLDSILKAGLRGEVKPTAPVLTPAELPGPSPLLGAVLAATTRHDKRIVVDFEATRQDGALECQGGLFGMVEESAEPVRGLHGTQIPIGSIEVSRGSRGGGGSICICGDSGCNLGPFIRTGGGR